MPESVENLLEGFNTLGEALDAAATAFLAEHTQPVQPDPATDQCCICLDNYSNEPCVQIINRPGCNHRFGKRCLETLLRSTASTRKTCPLCRAHWLEVFGTHEVGLLEILIDGGAFAAHRREILSVSKHSLAGASGAYTSRIRSIKNSMRSLSRSRILNKGYLSSITMDGDCVTITIDGVCCVQRMNERKGLSCYACIVAELTLSP
jgi:hypothetical protein